MKTFKAINFSIVMAIALFAVTACGSDQSKTDGMEQQHPAYSSAYVCPMHCESSGDDQPGSCPVCGMTYVKLEDHKADGHTHEGHVH